MFLAAAFALFIVFAGGAAQACPKDKQAALLATNAHKIERVMVAAAVVVSTAPAPIGAKGIFQYGGQCCGGGCYSHGVACASGCSSACSSVFVAMSVDFDFPDSLVSYSSCGPGGIVSTNPPPTFRPPRTSV
jgi:hypothetical protein